MSNCLHSNECATLSSYVVIVEDMTGSPDRAVIREKKWTVCVTAYGNTLTFPFEVAERKKCA
mgnify:CR=1 FL=1